MSFDLNKIAKTIYATTPADLVLGLNRVFNLGIVEEKSFFGSLFNIHLVIGKDAEDAELYFSNRDDLLVWIMSVVKTNGNMFQNYIDRFESRLVLADDIEFPEELDEDVIEADLNISDKDEGSFEEEIEAPVEPFEFTGVPEEFENEIVLEAKLSDEEIESINETGNAIVVEESLSEYLETIKEPNWKSLSGPKFSKEAIVELAKSSYGIELNIEDKKPIMLADFKAKFENR